MLIPWRVCQHIKHMSSTLDSISAQPMHTLLADRNLLAIQKCLRKSSRISPEKKMSMLLTGRPESQASPPALGSLSASAGGA